MHATRERQGLGAESLDLKHCVPRPWETRDVCGLFMVSIASRGVVPFRVSVLFERKCGSITETGTSFDSRRENRLHNVTSM